MVLSFPVYCLFTLRPVRPLQHRCVGLHLLKVLYMSVPTAGVGHHRCYWPADVRHNQALAGVPRRGGPALAASPREAAAPTPKTKSPRRLLVFTNEN